SRAGRGRGCDEGASGERRRARLGSQHGRAARGARGDPSGRPGPPGPLQPLPSKRARTDPDGGRSPQGRPPRALRARARAPVRHVAGNAGVRHRRSSAGSLDEGHVAPPAPAARRHEAARVRRRTEPALGGAALRARQRGRVGRRARPAHAVSARAARPGSRKAPVPPQRAPRALERAPVGSGSGDMTPTEVETLIRIVAEASAVVLEVYGKPFAVEYKAPLDPVTEADRAANELICKRLADAFPGAAIVAEESAPEAYAEFRKAE